MKPIHESKINKVIHDFLAEFPFFSDLSKDELEIVGDHIDMYQFEPGEILFHEGDTAECIYFLIDGEMDVIKESVGGSRIGVNKVVISTVYKGSTIGEMSILHNYLRSATVRSRTQAYVAALTKASFDLIVAQHARIGIKILMGLFHMLSRHLHKSTGRLADFVLTTSETE